MLGIPRGAFDLPVRAELHVPSNTRDIMEMMDTLVSGKTLVYESGKDA